MSAIYDIDGNPITIGGEITDEAVRRAFISAIADGTINAGSAIGATLSVSTYSSDWETNCNTAYTSLLEAYKTNPHTCVPFFISTDQHGCGLQQHRYINNIDKDGMDIVNINLGDTVLDVYGETTIQSFYDTTKQVKNYIGVVGNHECKHSVDRMLELTLSKAYGTTNFEQHRPLSKCDCFAVYDREHSVKWMVIEDHYINADGTGYTHGFDSATVEWMIDEMSKNDGMDIVILEHWPVWRTRRNRSEAEEVADTDRWGQETYLLRDFYENRKKKLSGTYADLGGAEHTYNFGACETSLLCTLHGHMHAEVMSTANGLTAYAANRYDTNSAAGANCVFGMIDRTNQLLHIWEFDGAGVTEELQLPI